jgi:hypothetical protein
MPFLCGCPFSKHEMFTVPEYPLQQKIHLPTICNSLLLQELSNQETYWVLFIYFYTYYIYCILRLCEIAYKTSGYSFFSNWWKESVSELTREFFPLVFKVNSDRNFLLAQQRCKNIKLTFWLTYIPQHNFHQWSTESLEPMLVQVKKIKIIILILSYFILRIYNIPSHQYV